MQAQADVLDRRRSTSTIDGFEVSPGVWVAEGADVHPDAMLTGPLVHRRLRQGRGRRRAARVHRARQQRRREGRRVPAPRRRPRQRLHRSADQPARLRHRQEHRHHARRPGRGGRGHRRRVRRRGGGHRLRRRARSTRSRPSRPAPSSARRHLGVARPAPACSGRAASPASSTSRSRPELAVRLASAFATTLKKGATVTDGT